MSGKDLRASGTLAHLRGGMEGETASAVAAAGLGTLQPPSASFHPGWEVMRQRGIAPGDGPRGSATGRLLPRPGVMPTALRLCGVRAGGSALGRGGGGLRGTARVVTSRPQVKEEPSAVSPTSPTGVCAPGPGTRLGTRVRDRCRGCGTRQGS